MGAVGAHRLLWEPGKPHLTPALRVRSAERDRPLTAQQVMVRLRLHVEDQVLEVEPEVLVWDW